MTSCGVDFVNIFWSWNDIFLCNCYTVSVLNKECTQGYLDVLKIEIAELSVLGDIMLIWDVIARTGDLIRENYTKVMETDDQIFTEACIYR